MRRLRNTVVAVAAITALLLSGCGGSDPDDDTPGGSPGERSDWDAGAGPEWDTLLEAARAEGRVVVGGPAFLAEPMVEAFRRDTGIDLEWLGATGSELSARLQQEVAAGNVTMDLKLGGPQELFVDYKSLLEPLAPQLILPTVTDTSKWRGGELPWSDPDETYMLRTSAYVFGWVVVNRDILDPARIQVWDDLLAEDLRGQIVSGDITTPSPGQGAAQHLYNVKGPEFVEELFLGQEVELIADNTQVVEQVARGTYPIALGAIQTVVERFRSQGFDELEVVLPEDHPGYLTGGFSVIVQAQNAPNPNAAQVFLNWFASPAGQRVYEEVMLETSARTDVRVEQVPDYVRPVDSADYWLDWELDWLVNHRARVAQSFVDMVGGR